MKKKPAKLRDLSILCPDLSPDERKAVMERVFARCFDALYAGEPTEDPPDSVPLKWLERPKKTWIKRTTSGFGLYRTEGNSSPIPLDYHHETTYGFSCALGEVKLSVSGMEMPSYPVMFRRDTLLFWLTSPKKMVALFTLVEDAVRPEGLEYVSVRPKEE